MQLTTEERERLTQRRKDMSEASKAGDVARVKALTAEFSSDVKQRCELLYEGIKARIDSCVENGRLRTRRALSLFMSDVYARLEARHDKDALLRAQVVSMEKRIRELEQTAIHDEGVFVEERSYGINSLVTCRNAAWVSRRATCSKPGTDDSWRMVSRGSR